MSQAWIAVETDLPALGEIVEVWVSLPRVFGTTWLSGRLSGHTATMEPLWLNAVTGEPFPQGWEVIRWRRPEGSNASPVTREALPNRA
jgi:hypothetical protein